MLELVGELQLDRMSVMRFTMWKRRMEVIRDYFDGLLPLDMVSETMDDGTEIKMWYSVLSVDGSDYYGVYLVKVRDHGCAPYFFGNTRLLEGSWDSYNGTLEYVRQLELAGEL